VSVIEAKFDSIKEAFDGFSSAKEISNNAEKFRKSALNHFNNSRKISAIVTAAQAIDKEGFEHFKSRVERDPIEVLQELPYIGPTTSYHLAKNIGFQVAKPDVHLTRIMNACGYNDVQDFCGMISKTTGDLIPVVDLVLWRYAAINPDYLNRFQKATPCSKAAKTLL
jgi:hypothetical protein